MYRPRQRYTAAGMVLGGFGPERYRADGWV